MLWAAGWLRLRLPALVLTEGVRYLYVIASGKAVAGYSYTYSSSCGAGCKKVLWFLSKNQEIAYTVLERVV